MIIAYSMQCWIGCQFKNSKSWYSLGKLYVSLRIMYVPSSPRLTYMEASRIGTQDKVGKRSLLLAWRILHDLFKVRCTLWLCLGQKVLESFQEVQNSPYVSKQLLRIHTKNSDLHWAALAYCHIDSVARTFSL